MADHAHDHAHDHAQDHVSGSMDIRDHEKTFEGFVRMLAWCIGLTLAVLVFLALVNS